MFKDDLQVNPRCVDNNKTTLMLGQGLTTSMSIKVPSPRHMPRVRKELIHAKAL